MPSDLLKPDKWVLLETQFISSALEASKSLPHRQRHELVAELRPVDLYCYLKARFGHPNGLQTAFRSDSSDNLIQWDWCLATDDGLIMLFGMNFRTEIHLFCKNPLDPDTKQEFVSAVKSDFSAHGRQMADVRKSLEKWTEFANPYQRIRRSVTELVKQLDSLELDPTADTLDDDFTAIEPNQARQKWQSVALRYSQGLGLCFGIRSMLPVMAEAFVNMLLYLLLREEIRNDKRLSENYFRQPIDVRVKSLSLNCFGFTKHIDYAHPACAQYHSLVNERNDLLHGNVVIDKLKSGEVFFDGMIPIFIDYRSMWQRTLGVEIGSVGLQRVKDELRIVDEFIQYVLSCLNDRTRQDVVAVLNKRELGVNAGSGKLGVLFPDHLVDMKAK